MVLSCILRSTPRALRNGLGTHCCRRAITTEYKNRFYTNKHEWVSVNGNIGTVGVSSFAQDLLGEVVFAQLPDVGSKLSAGDECGALESVKAAGEVFTPVSGTVTEKNDAVEASPSLINKSCYAEGWLFRVELSSASAQELQVLMDQPSYDRYVEESH